MSESETSSEFVEGKRLEKKKRWGKLLRGSASFQPIAACTRVDSEGREEGRTIGRMSPAA